MTGRIVYFARHGETDWNAEGRIQGQCDVPINRKGKIQARRNGRTLARLLGRAEGFDFVASPLGRTCETMELVRLAMRLAPDGYRVDERLLEVNFGDWQGFTLQEVDAREPGIVARRDASKWDFRPPGDKAESYAMLSSRVTDWLGTVAKPTICVTHGGVLRTLFHTLGGIDGNEAAMLYIPQDRILLLRGDGLEWL